MTPAPFSLVIAVSILCSPWGNTVIAQMRGHKDLSEPPPAATAGMGSGVERRENIIRATGLRPQFPDGVECTIIASPYGSPTRYDGSLRRDDRNAGLHGGMDLTLDAGTPLLAIAAGEVIAKGEGGRLEGIYLWLRHAPADTGRPFWVFSKYQHLSVLPTLNLGDRVGVGQVVALSGGSGTAGGHYGGAGYPHLHLTTTYGPNGEFRKMGMYGSMIKGQDAAIGDPLILYLQDIDDIEAAHSLPEGRKNVRVAVVDDAGSVHPAPGKTVWPTACRKK